MKCGVQQLTKFGVGRKMWRQSDCLVGDRKSLR